MKKEAVFALLFSCFIALLFFYQIFLGKIPFPGDNLVGQYEPYKSYSYNGYAPGGVTNKAQGPDVIKQLIPWKKFTIDSFKQLQIPFWNPYNFSGNSLMANFQSGVFYPGNIIFFVLSFYSAWSLYILLIPVLSIYFSYLFLRRLGLLPAAALFGGVSFAFSLYMVVWMEYGNIGHTFLWLPLILYFADRFLEKATRINFLGIVAALFFSILAGYIQGIFYIYIITLIYFFWKGYFEKRVDFKKSCLFLTALVFPIFLSAFQILPTLELFGSSTRGNYSLEQIRHMLNPVYYWVTVFAPDFFGNPATRNYWYSGGTYIEQVSYFGLIPLACCLFAIYSLFKKIEVKIFTLLFFGSLLISTDLFITRFFYLIPIPVISTTVATRILSIFSFSGAVLAAFGFNQILLSQNKKQIFKIISVLLVLLVIVFMFVVVYPKISTDPSISSTFNISKRNLIIPIVTILAFGVVTFYFYSKKLFKSKYKKTIYVAAIFIIVLFDLFYYFQKITPFAPASYAYPKTAVVQFLKDKGGIDRFWGYGRGYIESNFQTYDGTFSPEGNDPLHIKNYTELLASSATGRLPEALPRPDANIAGGFGKENLANNPYRQKVLNITGVKYVLNKDEGIIGTFNPDYVTFPEDRYKLVWQEGFWQAYENLHVTPRFFLTNKYIVIPDKAYALRTLFHEDFNEKDTLLLSQDPKIPKGVLAGSSSLEYYSPNKVIIKTVTSAPSLLYLSDNFYPGWTATVDGVKTEIYLADYTFRAVVVPSGKHIVTFEYIPKTFYHGVYIGILGIIMLGFTTLYIYKKNGY